MFQIFVAFAKVIYASRQEKNLVNSQTITLAKKKRAFYSQMF